MSIALAWCLIMAALCGLAWWFTREPDPPVEIGFVAREPDRSNEFVPTEIEVNDEQ